MSIGYTRGNIQERTMEFISTAALNDLQNCRLFRYLGAAACTIASPFRQLVTRAAPSTWRLVQVTQPQKLRNLPPQVALNDAEIKRPIHC